jgi:hypothetical protein
LDLLIKWLPEAKGPLRRQHARALEQLRQDPRDGDAARRLYFATFALKERNLSLDFPRALPKENPERWRLLAWWMWRATDRDGLPLASDAVEWDAFYREGLQWVRGNLAAARLERTGADYSELALRARLSLIRIGVKGVQLLAKAGETDRAAALAHEVQLLAGYRGQPTRTALAAALKGRLPERFGFYDFEQL